MLSTLQQLTKIGHQMDGALNRYKSVLYPKRYFNYRRWLKQQRRDIHTDKPVVVFDFRDTRIDGPQGRRFYSLFIFFVRTGFYPVLRDNYLMLGNIQEKYKQYCLQENFSVLADPNELPKNYILVTDKLFSALESNAFKTITVNYRPDYKSIDVCFPMPFPMFPPIYAMQQDLQLESYRRQQRQWAIFFGGDAEQGKYNKKTIREIYAKLSRAQIIQCLSTQLASDQYRQLTSNDELSSAQNSEYQGLVVMNTRLCKVNPEDWLGNLARANFFLACPGVRYPMSHNLIEALAVGSIPITQYPEMFFPPLENGKNCLVFNNEDELLTVVNKAMNMNAAEIASMSHEAIEYYETYMAPTHCIQRLLNHASQRISLRLLPFLKAGGGFA